MAVKRVSPESSLEAAMAAFGQFDLDGAVAHLSAAVRGFTTAGNLRQAAMACSRLGDVYGNFLGNRVAARPWFTRAVRMLENEEPCVEQGWVAIAPMGCDVDDPAELRTRAELALARAREFGDGVLEIKALADGGLAHVQAGRLAEGMTMMDEAMALICGGGDTELTDAHAMSVCSFYTACWYTADYGRFEAWSPLLRQRGLIGGEGSAAVLRSRCDSVQGILLSHQGRWHEAEAVLERALADIQQAMPMMVWHPPIALADLRIRQGRLAEAEALLLGRDDHIQALLPTARLHLVRGDLELAIAGARRGLRVLGDDRVRAAALLGVIVEAELGRGDTAAAADASGPARRPCRRARVWSRSPPRRAACAPRSTAPRVTPVQLSPSLRPHWPRSKTTTSRCSRRRCTSTWHARTRRVATCPRPSSKAPPRGGAGPHRRGAVSRQPAPSSAGTPSTTPHAAEGGLPRRRHATRRGVVDGRLW